MYIRRLPRWPLVRASPKRERVLLVNHGCRRPCHSEAGSSGRHRWWSSGRRRVAGDIRRRRHTRTEAVERATPPLDVRGGLVRLVGHRAQLVVELLGHDGEARRVVGRVSRRRPWPRCRARRRRRRSRRRSCLGDSVSSWVATTARPRSCSEPPGARCRCDRTTRTELRSDRRCRCRPAGSARTSLRSSADERHHDRATATSTTMRPIHSTARPQPRRGAGGSTSSRAVVRSFVPTWSPAEIVNRAPLGRRAPRADGRSLGGVHVHVGPIPSDSASAWIAFARGVLDDRRTAQSPDLSPEVCAGFVGFLDEWDTIASSSPTLPLGHRRRHRADRVPGPRLAPGGIRARRIGAPPGLRPDAPKRVRPSIGPSSTGSSTPWPPRAARSRPTPRNCDRPGRDCPTTEEDLSRTVVDRDGAVPYNRGMRISEGVEWGVHCCTLLAVLAPDQTLPAPRLAEYHDVPRAYLAKHLQALSACRHRRVRRRARGAATAWPAPADEITVLDVVEAIEGDEPAFRCGEIRQRGPTAVPAECYTRHVRHRPDACGRPRRRGRPSCAPVPSPIS